MTSEIAARTHTAGKILRAREIKRELGQRALAISKDHVLAINNRDTNTRSKGHELTCFFLSDLCERLNIKPSKLVSISFRGIQGIKLLHRLENSCKCKRMDISIFAVL